MAQVEIPPSREEWAEWKAHPVTQWYLWALSQVQATQQQTLAEGRTLRASSDDTAQATARAVGYVHGIADALGLEPDVTEALS